MIEYSDISLEKYKYFLTVFHHRHRAIYKKRSLPHDYIPTGEYTICRNCFTYPFSGDSCDDCGFNNEDLWIKLAD